MTLSTLLCGFGLVLAPPTDGAADIEAQLQDDLALAVHLDQTHFVARSLAQAPLLLVFASDDEGPQVAFWLPPGASYVEDFARGTLDGLQMEVVSAGDGQWMSTGSLDLDDGTALGAANLWVLACGHALTQSGEGAPLEAAVPAGSSLPPQVVAANAGHSAMAQNDHAAAFHVPVPTPSVKPKENKPPKLRKRPLPPV